MRIARTIAVLTALVAGSFVAPVAPASDAAVYCQFALIWQNADVPGEDAGGTFSPNCVMAEGAGPNNAVRDLQYSLNRCHGRSLATDGEFGPKTRQALITVQQALRITADGVYGPQTARAMSHRVINSTTACKRITF